MLVAHARHPPSLCASCTCTRTFAELRVGACAKYDYNIQTDQSWYCAYEASAVVVCVLGRRTYICRVKVGEQHVSYCYVFE